MRSLWTLLTLLCASPALAGYDSAYSEFDPENKSLCHLVSAAEPGDEAMSSGGYECKGFGGYVVSFAEGDLRSFVSFGKQAGNHCAATQTFSGFNSVGKKIEWRLKDGKPIATILRWSVSYDPEDATKQKSWLVVTKLEDNNSCHMGYVEGGFPQANDRARKLADTAVDDYSCAKSTPEFLANAGTETENIATSGPCEAERGGD